MADEDWFSANAPPQQPEQDWFAQNAPKTSSTVAEPPKQGGVVSGILSGLGQALNPINLVKGALDIGQPSDISQIYKYGKTLGEIVTGTAPDEAIGKNIPELQQQREAVYGKLGTKEQAKALTGIGLQLGMTALPFLHGETLPRAPGSLAETAGIAKPEVAPETVTPEPITPVATDAVTPPEVLGKVEPVAPDLPTGTGERIQSVAVRLPNGEVRESFTHGDLIDNLSKEERMHPETTMGFTTTSGRFVNRQEAFKIAKDYLPDLPKYRGEDKLHFNTIEPLTEAGDFSQPVSPVPEAPVSTTATPLTQTPQLSMQQWTQRVVQDTNQSIPHLNAFSQLVDRGVPPDEAHSLVVNSKSHTTQGIIDEGLSKINISGNKTPVAQTGAVGTGGVQTLFRPAARLENGDVYIGNTNHPEALEAATSANGGVEPNNVEMGWVDKNGQFLTRKEAAERVQKVTPSTGRAPDMGAFVNKNGELISKYATTVNPKSIPEGSIEEGLNQEHPDVAKHIDRYVMNNDATGIFHALKDPGYEAYRNDLHRLLRSVYGDEIPVSRISGYGSGGTGQSGGLAYVSVSTNPGWGEAASKQGYGIWRGTVKPEDVILAGHEAEGELIVKKSGIKTEPDVVPTSPSGKTVEPPSVSVEGQAPTAPLSTQTEGGIENATQERQQQESSITEHPGVPQGSDLPANAEEVRQGTGERTSDSGSVEPAAQEQVARPEPQIPEGSKATVNLKTSSGKVVPKEMDAREAEGIFTKERSSYKALLDCLGG